LPVFNHEIGEFRRLSARHLSPRSALNVHCSVGAWNPPPSSVHQGESAFWAFGRNPDQGVPGRSSEARVHPIRHDRGQCSTWHRQPRGGEGECCQVVWNFDVSHAHPVSQSLLTDNSITYG
jgi:hypothetical protein